jgi:hypothetical protein
MIPRSRRDVEFHLFFKISFQLCEALVETGIILFIGQVDISAGGAGKIWFTDSLNFCGTAKAFYIFRWRTPFARIFPCMKSLRAFLNVISEML